ncbi:hypothetical protein CFP56_002356 [Quercus suber]|uniref:Uncharacterized protein n=1 Tax=Quercus suber TaxID=58331 RepID=A0AAW0ILB7_QUESU
MYHSPFLVITYITEVYMVTPFSLLDLKYKEVFSIQIWVLGSLVVVISLVFLFHLIHFLLCLGRTIWFFNCNTVTPPPYFRVIPEPVDPLGRKNRITTTIAVYCSSSTITIKEVAMTMKVMEATLSFAIGISISSTTFQSCLTQFAKDLGISNVVFGSHSKSFMDAVR